MPFLVTIRMLSRLAGVAWLLILSAGGAGIVATAQSTDIAAPAPVRKNEVLGTISARDIGDPRLTDHFYAFTGNPGDLLITVDSRNINGDVDVFTSTGLRPLLKLTVYASNSSPTTKSIYLRKQESLILRIEGRTPNDDEGTYRVYFGGSFEPISGESLTGERLAENESGATDPATPGAKSGKKGRRVTSVGARIEEPPAPEVAAAPTPEASPVESTPSGEVKETSKPESTPAEVTKPEVAKAPARTVRGRRLPGRRTVTPVPPKEEPVKSDAPAAPPTEETDAAAKAPPAGRRSTRKPPAARTAAKTPEPVEPVPESGPRLMIETNDGTLINRYMSGVRRVVVENGQVVVTGKDGKIERVPLANVVKMSIAP